MPSNGPSKRRWTSSRASRQRSTTQTRSLTELARSSKVALVRRFVGRKMSVAFPMISIT